MSCSSGTLKKLLGKKKPAPPVKKEEKLIPGPTANDRFSFFQDKTSEYGLSGYSATQLYAVDFNADGKTDLVLMPSYFAIPVFLQFGIVLLPQFF